MSTQIKNTGLAGTILASALASVCCVGPLVFAILGISGAAFARSFEPLRPYFVGLTVFFLGVAFYFTYTKPPAELCEDGSYCANPKSDRINKTVLWIVAVLALIFIFSPNLIGFFFS